MKHTKKKKKKSVITMINSVNKSKHFLVMNIFLIVSTLFFCYKCTCTIVARGHVLIKVGMIKIVSYNYKKVPIL